MGSNYCCCFCGLLLPLLLQVFGTRGVVITNLHVPLSASHEASLDCKYDLQGDQLYDVKWYKDGQHFYRCQPNGHVQEFQLEGIQIYNPTTFPTYGSCPLTLIGLNFKSGGEYRCEVTIEGPPFKAAARSGRMKIIQVSRQIQDIIGTEKPKVSNNISYSAASSGVIGSSAIKNNSLFLYHVLFCVIFIQ